MRLRILPFVLVTTFAIITIKASDVLFVAATPKQSHRGATAVDPSQALAAEGSAAHQETTPEAAMQTPVLSPNAPPGPQAIQPDDTSKVERELLESLSKRRKELDDWSKSISVRESVLNATEMKINQKMQELKSLQTQVSKLLAQYNQKEDAKIQSLVKIYENMKPKDAADIFNDLDMDVLLEVVGAMKERKVAPILAKLDPAKARAVTLALAKQRRLQFNAKP